MENMTEINDYRIVRTLSKSKVKSTYVVIKKGLNSISEDYFKILKLRIVEGTIL